VANSSKLVLRPQLWFMTRIREEEEERHPKCGSHWPRRDEVTELWTALR